MRPEGFVIASREVAILLGGTIVLIGIAFILRRVSRIRDHGLSIRLQLFLAIGMTALLATGIIGLWVVERLQTGAVQAIELEAGPAFLGQFLFTVGPKATLLFVLLGLIAAAAAFVLGDGIARPLRQLARSADAIAGGERHAVLPPPVGREVRHLTRSFESMRRSLEDRHHIEQFVADLSHELKNPVSAIRAATEVLQEGAAEDPEARTRFLNLIDEAGTRLELLLQDLLALARLEARGIEPDTTRVALGDVIRTAIEGARPRLDAGDLKIDLALQDVRVPGSRRWLRRAVDNLLSNAIRYSEAGGTIQISFVQGERCAILRVHDCGPGVSEMIRERVFERFVTDRAEMGGTGLGLAIVRSVAELHGGGASLVEPQPEQGACFELRVRI